LGEIVFDTSDHLPTRVSSAILFYHHLFNQIHFLKALTKSMFLHVFVASPFKNIFDGLKPLRAFSIRRLFCESIENSIHVLPNKPPAPFMVIFRGAVPYQGALEHGNTAFGIDGEDGDVRVSKHT
jgi:hypothetical protein